MRLSKKKIFAFLSILLIILLATFLRVYRMPELATFRSDQAIELTSTFDILHGDFTLIGIKTSNSEVRNGAVMYYVMAPILYLFNFHPIAGGILQTLLSVATAAVVYIVAKKSFPSYAALLAAFFIATSALLVQFSRQTLLAFYPLFFCSVALYLASEAIKKKSLIFTVLLGILCGFSLQIHYATLALFLFGVTLPVFLRPLSKLRLVKYYLSLFVGFFVGYLPMILFEVRHEFFNSKMLWELITNHNSSDQGFNLFNYLINSLAQYFFGNSVIFACLAVIFVTYFLVKVRARLSLIEKLCLIQIVCLIGFVVFFVHENVPHYLIPAVPSIVILVAGLVGKIKSNMRGRLVAVTMAAIFFLINLPNYHFSDNHGLTMASGWNQPGIEKSASIIHSDVGDTAFNLAMIVDQENQGLPLRYFLHVQGKEALPVYAYDKATYLYVLAEPGTELSKVSMWEVTSFGKAEVTKEWDIQNGFILYRLEKVEGQ